MTENRARIRRLAERLIEARNLRRPLDGLDADLIPGDAREAGLVDDLVAQLSGWTVRGWKIGCTSEHAQQLLGADGPFAGRVYSLHNDDVTLSADDLMVEPYAEGEVAFVMGHDLVPSSSVPERSSVLKAVQAVAPAIEIVGGRFRDFFNSPLTGVMADAGANSHLVVGPRRTDVDPRSLIGMKAVMRVDDEITGRGTGADVLGDPVDALLWLVRHLGERGLALRQGQVITTGTATQVSHIPSGSTATLTLGGVGSVKVHRA